MYEMVIICLKFNRNFCLGGMKMATPKELIRMAEERRRMKRVREGFAVMAAQDTAALPPPMPTRHANYTKLMRSHDRMGSRHLSQSRA